MVVRGGLRRGALFRATLAVCFGSASELRVHVCDWSVDGQPNTGFHRSPPAERTLSEIRRSAPPRGVQRKRRRRRVRGLGFQGFVVRVLVARAFSQSACD